MLVTVLYIILPIYVISNFVYFQADLSSGNFLQRKVREYFLENDHHLTLVMTPDVSI